MRTENTPMNRKLMIDYRLVAHGFGRKLSPERMRTVLESIRENPILSNAANKAGIHPKGLAYWLKCSAAGDAKYRLEWEGFELGFHEHCQTAIEEAHDKPQEAAWYIAMSTDLKDGDGEPVPQASWKEKGKLLRLLLETGRPDKWGKNRKIDVRRIGADKLFGTS